LKNEERIYDETYKILLLGTGDSGKSTFLRQMVDIHGDGLEDERERFSVVLKDNLLESIKIFLYHLVEHTDEEIQGEMDDITEIMECVELDKNIAKKIEKLTGKKKYLEYYLLYENQIQIPSASRYYWENAKRIAEPDFVPTTDDIVRSKIKTTGVNETSFVFNKKKICNC